MRQFHGLQALCRQHSGLLSPRAIANRLIDDLAAGHCEIYGHQEDHRVVLARLDLLPETLIYDAFDRRLDWSVSGPILRADYVPLTYRMEGQVFAITGRCSVISKVCGVDLYLHRSYTCVVGDMARQRFSVSTADLADMCKSL